MTNRRAFLNFLAASPLLAGHPAELFGQTRPLANVSEALDVFDFETMAQQLLPPAHWGYLASGVEGDVTLRANREGFSRYQLRSRRLVDISQLDTATTLFGAQFASPILLCPVGSQKAFHQDGELASARAARARGHLQILSTQSSSGVEDVIKARGAPIWYQLYTTDNFAVTTRLLKRAEAAGCHAVAITVDLPVGRNAVTAARFRQMDTRDCTACHGGDGPGGNNTVNAKPMFAGIETRGLALNSASLTWDFISRVRDVTKMKILIKGLESREDAVLAVEKGADGIVVSNHGGRASESERSTIDSLPEMVAGAAGRIPIIVDSGFRRGTDIFKALALGASAVGIGRPYIWGLASFGQQGVERVLEMLNNELRLAMAGCGVRSLKEISPAALVDSHR